MLRATHVLLGAALLHAGSAAAFSHALRGADAIFGVVAPKRAIPRLRGAPPVRPREAPGSPGWSHMPRLAAMLQEGANRWMAPSTVAQLCA
jgi:hypothetical protein